MNPETILEKFKRDLAKRQQTLRADRNTHTFYLKEIDPGLLIELSYIHVLKGLQRKGTLTEVIVASGRSIRQSLKLPQDSVLDAHAGWFVLVTFMECGLVSVIKKSVVRNSKVSKNLTYVLEPKSWQQMKSLWSLIDATKITAYPFQSPPADWKSPIHENGVSMIKKGHPTALKRLHPSNQPVCFDVLNKLQKTGWIINNETFAVYQRCMRIETQPSPFKYVKEIDFQKKKSLIMEMEAIEQIALAFINEPFYHQYNFDFRGRIYTNTAYLHEQSSDNAKGILKFAEKVRLGSEGFYWLCVHTANCFGNDKIRLDERSEFVKERIPEFIDIAKNPLVNTSWMTTDAPFSFLSCCFELKAIMEHVVSGGLIEDFESNLPLYIDGSNNGVQHLVAMSKDEEIAPLVNVIPQDLPGDVYMFIAKYVWEELAVRQDALTQNERDQFWPIFEESKALQARYKAAPSGSEERALVAIESSEWRNKTKTIREKLFPVYWMQITSAKDHRKICKRNTMTLGYGATKHGMGSQVIEDTREMSEYLRDKDYLWGILLGGLIYETCYKQLKGPASMLRMFQTLAERSNELGKFLQWNTPSTNFPVVQAYRKPVSKRTKLRYGDEEMKIVVEAWEEATLDEAGSKTGAAPNIVHSFDAGHLAMTVYNADYPVSVIHDSFGSHAGNMSKLFIDVRKTFVDFYLQDPLLQILKQLDSEDLMPERGNLNVIEILGSDYAFC